MDSYLYNNSCEYFALSDSMNVLTGFTAYRESDAIRAEGESITGFIAYRESDAIRAKGENYVFDFFFSTKVI